MNLSDGYRAALTMLIVSLLMAACGGDECDQLAVDVMELTIVDSDGHTVQPDAIQLLVPGADEPWDIEADCIQREMEVCSISPSNGEPGTYTVFVQAQGQHVQRDVEVHRADRCHLATEQVTLTLEAP